MTRFYGLTPADVDQMTERELSEYHTYMQRVLSEGGA